jgi:hypothetical protein
MGDDVNSDHRLLLVRIFNQKADTAGAQLTATVPKISMTL